MKRVRDADRSGGQVRAAAHDYAARGWSPIPIEADGKRPLVPWSEFQRRIATSDEIDAWYQRWPQANVGIVTGTVSGIVVIDVDPRHGGAASLEQAQREHGTLPHTVEAVTGGGGRHLYFAQPALKLHNRTSILPGIDLRADGGCVVAPPSRHLSGRRYAWAAGSAPDEAPLAPLPPWALPAAEVRGGHSPAHWRQLLRDGVAEGSRNSTLASLTGHLLWHGVDPEVALELLRAWNRERCRPPLPDEEVARVVHSIARLQAREAGA